MEQFAEFTSAFSSLAWGLPLLCLLVGGGLYLMIRSRFLPFRHLGHAIQVLRGKYDNELDVGEITHFKALTTALSSTIGMGNISGVAVAIAIGGPGAIFWLWISGITGMAIKFFTCTLSILYRGKDSEGKVQGGPMYFITEGLGQNWKPLAVFFSLFGMIGALPVINVNQLTQAVQDILLVPNGFEDKVLNGWVIGITLAIITSIVVMGGLKRISNTASRVVPSMVVLYFISVIAILILHADKVPHYFTMIFTDAFGADSYTASAAAGNEKAQPFLGGMLGGLILLGIRRGAFSNEAGIGTAPMAHGAAKTNEPVREGLVAMLGPAIDTLVVCTLTALAILVTDAWQLTGVKGVSMTAAAFGDSFPSFGKYLLLICVAAFSISSLFSYSYYGTKCMAYLFGVKYGKFYNIPYVLSIIAAAVTSFGAILDLIDGVFALMAIPTMTATLILAPKVMREAKIYFTKIEKS